MDQGIEKVMRCVLALLAVGLPAWTVDFATDIHPVLASRCISCHSGSAPQAGFSLESRTGALKGKEHLVARVRGQAGMRMPPSGDPLSEKQIESLEAWVKADMPWVDVTAKPGSNWVAPFEYRSPTPPASPMEHPIDRFVDSQFRAKKIAWREPVDDATFVRRVYLDLWGITPTPQQFAEFRGDRAELIDRLLADRGMVTGHWISFWNDLLRDDIRAYHGGEKPIRTWLQQALKSNMPYDQMVRELVNPVGPDSPEGFLLGVNWRGDVSASQRPFMQAAQNTAQVFLGVNLKCASCHDSFINKYTLKQSYEMAALFSEEPKLELYRCDAKTDQFTTAAFLFPQAGATIPEGLSLSERRGAAASLFTSPKNGRLARTFVNRIWDRLFGRGIVDLVDDMDAEPWNPDLLDWLASDFARHNFDIHRLLRQILTSKTWQMPATEHKGDFRGPLPRRLTAEQVIDSLSAITGEWRVSQTDKSARFAREWEHKSSPLSRALGRPIRDQVFTTRNDESATLQALELVNGETLHRMLRRGSQRLEGKLPEAPSSLWDSSGVRQSGVRDFEIPLNGAEEVWLLIEDVGSYDPERTRAGWASMMLVGEKGEEPLDKVATISKFERAGLTVGGKEHAAIAPALGKEIVFAIGPGWSKLRGKAVLDDVGKLSDVGSAVRFYVFPKQPDRNLLARLTGPSPVASAGQLAPEKRVEQIYWQTLGRSPSPQEAKLAQGAPLDELLWILVNHPEFQYVY